MAYMIQRIIRAMINDPFVILSYPLDRFFTLLLARKHNIYVLGKLSISGRPLVDIRSGAKLYIEDGVWLNSRNRGYHINMHSPVKLFADKPGAVIRIGANTRVHGTCIHAQKSVIIGSNCLIAANCQIFDGNAHDVSFPDVKNRITTTGESKPINIEDDVWVGTNSIILPGVTIGRGSVISANSVVNSYIPPMVIAGGNPAKILKEYLDSNGLDSG